MYDAIVIGKGILGAATAAAFLKQKRKVLVLDREEPLSGTGASAGHLRPSKKFTGLSNAEYDASCEYLNEILGVDEEDFQIRVPVIGTVKERIVIGRVDPDKLEALKHVKADVTQVDPSKQPTVHYVRHGKAYNAQCKLLVVAAGYWTEALVKQWVDCKDMYYKMGCSPHYPDIKGLPAMVQMWAPYKYKMVGRLNSGELWTSNGTAIIPKNWTDEIRDKCESMLREWIGAKKRAHRIDVGVRPFHSAKPCLLQAFNSSKTAWVLTGGGKFGTLSAGWAARKLAEVQP